MKKVIALLLTVVLTATVCIGGTVAYLQDTDEQANTMTLGRVKIEQHEYEREVGTGGNYVLTTSTRGEGYKLKDFTQDKPLYPTTESTNNGAGGWDSTYVWMDQEKAKSAGYMQVFSSELAQDKFVFVENTGTSAAYVRTLVAFECGSKTYEEWNSLVASSHHFTWNDLGDIGPVEINGNKYIVAEFTYKGYDGGRHLGGVLPAGETTYCSLAQVYMYSTATNEDCEALDGNNNGKYDILVLSQAVQTAGFDDAQTALDTAFGDVTAANAAEWFKNVKAPTAGDDDAATE